MTEELWEREGIIRHSWDVDNLGYTNATFFIDSLTGEELLRLGWGHIFIDGQRVRLILKPFEDR